MEQPLKLYLDSYHETEEYQQVFYMMDTTMKYIHSNNYRITSFDPASIILGLSANKEAEYITFKQLAPFSEQALDEMYQNIYNLAFLAVGTYTSTLDYLTPQFAKENLSQMEPFLPVDDIRYFKSVLQNQNYFYYCDYKDNQMKQQTASFDESINTAAGRGQGQVKTKATPQGVLYSGLPEDKMAAFATRFVLPFLILSLSLLIPLLAFFFALSGNL